MQTRAVNAGDKTWVLDDGFVGTYYPAQFQGLLIANIGLEVSANVHCPNGLL